MFTAGGSPARLAETRANVTEGRYEARVAGGVASIGASLDALLIDLPEREAKVGAVTLT